MPLIKDGDLQDLPYDLEGAYRVDQGDGIIVDLIVDNRYEGDRHIYMMGITSPTPFQSSKAAFVQLASPTLLWVADWTVSRPGGIPNVPNPNPLSQNSDWVLLDCIVEPAAIGLMGNVKTPIYRISGTYVYGHKNPPADIYDAAVFPLPAFIENVYPRRVPEENLKDNIINDDFGVFEDEVNPIPMPPVPEPPEVIDPDPVP